MWPSAPCSAWSRCWPPPCPHCGRHASTRCLPCARSDRMGDLIKDLRFAARGLLRTPGFTLAAVLALALGIGATTAIFSVVHAVLLRSLGWGQESRLISVRGNFPGQGLFEIPLSAAEYFDLRRAPFLESVGLYANYTAALQGERAERVRAGYATGSF